MHLVTSRRTLAVNVFFISEQHSGRAKLTIRPKSGRVNARPVQYRLCRKCLCSWVHHWLLTIIITIYLRAVAARVMQLVIFYAELSLRNFAERLQCTWPRGLKPLASHTGQVFGLGRFDSQVLGLDACVLDSITVDAVNDHWSTVAVRVTPAQLPASTDVSAPSQVTWLSQCIHSAQCAVSYLSINTLF